MAAETQTGMDRGEMKRFLTKSKQEPVNCAIGVGEDKSLALLMLSASQSARSLQGDLQKQFPSVFNTRFGTAVVDPAEDPTLVKFRLNKPVTSMARRLVKTLKGTGFRKVQILLEDGTPVETAEEEADKAAAGTQATGTQATGTQATAGTQAGDGPAGTPAQAAPKPDAAALAQALTALVRRIPEVTDPARKEALAKQAREASVNIKMGNLVYAAAGIELLRRALDATSAAGNTEADPRPEVPAKPDTAALVAALTALVRRMADVTDPARREALSRLAHEVQVNIKTGNLTDAAAGIEALRQGLDTGPTASGAGVVQQPDPASPPPRPAKDAARRPVRKPPSSYVSIRGREIWRTARETVDGQIGALIARLRSMPDPEMQRIATFGLNGATGKLSVGLLTALSEADSVPPDQQPAARARARGVVGEFRGFLQQNALVRLLDENPFGVAVTIRTTLGNALVEIDQALAA